MKMEKQGCQVTVVSPLSENLRRSGEVASISDILPGFLESCSEVLYVVFFPILEIVAVDCLCVLPTALELKSRDSPFPFGCSSTSEGSGGYPPDTYRVGDSSESLCGRSPVEGASLFALE